MSFIILVFFSLFASLAIAGDEEKETDWAGPRANQSTADGLITVDDVVKALSSPDDILFRLRGLRPPNWVEEGDDVMVKFEFDSATLNKEARKILDLTAAALTSPELTGENLLIVGHTDAAGTDKYNLALSERRVKAVFNYLIESGGIDPRRLSVLAKGEKLLLETEPANSPKNRRVEILLDRFE